MSKREHRAGGQGMLRTRMRGFLLGVPLVYKILIANGVILVATAGLVGGVALGLGEGLAGAAAVERLAALAAGVLLPSLVLNALIVHTALAPLRGLEDTATRVLEGDLAARVAPSPTADARLRRVVAPFNGMLDGLSEQRARQRELAARFLHAEESERRRISQELLADPAQVLASLLLRLRLLERAANGSPGPESVAELRSGINETLDGIRRIARGLRPPELDEVGLRAALEAHVRTLAESAGLHVRVEGATVDPSRLADGAAVALYRILQEGLANVLRHAETSHAVIRLGFDGDVLRAELEDRGAGFDVAAVLADPDRAVGLRWMRERASLVGGTVSVRSRPGEGTRVVLELPASGEARANHPRRCTGAPVGKANRNLQVTDLGKA